MNGIATKASCADTAGRCYDSEIKGRLIGDLPTALGMRGVRSRPLGVRVGQGSSGLSGHVAPTNLLRLSRKPCVAGRTVW